MMTGEEGLKVLGDNSVIVGGDQLTRVRLDGVKHLRAHAPDPQGRFEHLHPVVCEMWHNQVDLTEVFC